MDFPPLAWPAVLHADHFMLLDETRLPEKITYIPIHDFRETAGAVRDMKTRAFGQLLAVFYALILTGRQADNLAAEIETAGAVLEASRPTFPFGRYTDMVTAWAGECADSEELTERILIFLEEIKNMRLARAEAAADLFEDGDRVLTHCNTSGELLLTARICREQGKNLRFYATETRPYFQGRLTAWEMSQDGFDIMLIPDNRAAMLVTGGKISKIITGSDRVARNGDIVNKTGTRQLAQLARAGNIPFYAFVQEPGDTATGAEVEIEYRPREEVTRFRGHVVFPEETCVFYPAFDMTPAEYIQKLITFGRILDPAELPAGWETDNWKPLTSV